MFKILVVKLSTWNEMGLASDRTPSLTVCGDNSPIVSVHALVECVKNARLITLSLGLFFSELCLQGAILRDEVMSLCGTKNRLAYCSL